MPLLSGAPVRVVLLLLAVAILYVIYENYRMSSISAALILRNEEDEKRPGILQLVRAEVNRLITDETAHDDFSDEVG
ncbi:unnamed protein product [Schistocephalus solidus]|uniref:Sensor histidine kinase n=1 Tax=Schistocephalus solidus TaxID=70667 RepID=A0A183T5L7_SCHSO|nr:unnamed protein product [Schistocephalus solidus]